MAHKEGMEPAVKTVIVTVQGVVVRDYDTDGQDEDRLTIDEDGEPMVEAVWEHEDEGVA
jgi:hypothetical protein